MIAWLKSLDRILRGEATRPDALKNGSIEFHAVGLTIVVIVLAMIYGFCMGSFSLFKELSESVDPNDRYWQLLASTVKVPALFLLTLLVTFPSLYVFNALVGSRLNLTSMLKLLIASLAVNLAVLASLGPITAFFSVSTASYHFMQVFNVGMFTIAGMLGLMFLNQTLNRMSAKQLESQEAPLLPAILEKDVELSTEGPSTDALESTETPEIVAKSSEPIAAIDSTEEHVLSNHVRLVFRIWVVAFCLVGAQMGWVLRPFIGSPSISFTWFRERESNFFQAVLAILQELFIG